MSVRPLVSVSVSTYNCARYVVDAVASALAQEYEPLEVVVVDDCSSDGTYELLRSVDDNRLRLYRNEHRLGQVRNRNRGICVATGSLIKFLDGDDYLYPGCVSEMVEAFSLDEAIALVFCARTIVGPTGAESDDEWSREFRRLERDIVPVPDHSDGRLILTKWLDQGARGNWIGEPTAVMVRRAHLQMVGGFRDYVNVVPDMDLWARVMCRGRVAFIATPLVAYRRGHESETTRNWGTNRSWLAGLWIYESLADDAAIRTLYPHIGELLAEKRREVWRTVAKLGRGGSGAGAPFGPYVEYVGFRMRRRFQSWRRALRRASLYRAGDGPLRGR